MKDKLYVGAMLTTGTRRDHARLYIFDPANDIWNVMNTPVYYFAMTTYNNDLIIVNGRQYIGNETSGPLTDKVLSFNCEWEEVQGVPTMNTKRCATSVVNHRHYLVVAGGYVDSGMSDIVEIFNGQLWVFGTSLPHPSVEMKSILHDGQWYLMGGRNQERNVYYVDLDSLISRAAYKPNGLTEPSASVWKKLPHMPYKRSSPAVFGKRLVAVGGKPDLPGSFISSSAIHAYCAETRLWVLVGHLPNRLHSSCTVVLPNGELMVIGGMVGYDTKLNKVHRASLTGKSEYTVMF